MTAKQIFNTASLLHYTEDDRELSAQLLKMALQDIPDFLNKAEDLIRNQQFMKAAVWIHKIKGIAGTVGADSLFSLCITTEDFLKNTDSLEAAQTIVDSIKKCSDEFSTHRDVLDWISNVQY